jgi:thiamine-monophosphate kinase
MKERDFTLWVSKQMKGGKGMIVGDDSSVFIVGKEYFVISTDMLHEKTDFPEGISLRQIGWMSVASSISDIAAMGASPSYLLVALGLPEISKGKEIFRGMGFCARKFGAEIIGGDVDRHDEMTIVTTCIGRAKKIIRRGGASPGDFLCVTGNLGRAAAGMKAIKHNLGFEKLKLSLYKPFPRVKEGKSLTATGWVTSMTDISDGLFLSAWDLAKSSNVGFRIYEDKIPVDRATKKVASLTRTPLLDLVSYGGDYELLFTVKRGKVENIKNVKLTVIGKAIKKGLFLDDRKIELKGYQHFTDE